MLTGALGFLSLAQTSFAPIVTKVSSSFVNFAETATTSGGMDSIINKLNTGLNSSTIFATVGELMPWVITLVIASLGLYFLRKLVKGAGKGKVRF